MAINVAFIRANGNAGTARFDGAGARTEAMQFLEMRILDALGGRSDEKPVVLALVQDTITERFERYIVDQSTGEKWPWRFRS